MQVDLKRRRRRQVLSPPGLCVLQFLVYQGQVASVLAELQRTHRILLGGVWSQAYSEAGRLGTVLAGAGELQSLPCAVRGESGGLTRLHRSGVKRTEKAVQESF